MPAKRRPDKARDHRVTPAAVEAFRIGDVAGLRKALALRPWQISPLEAQGTCPWPKGTAAAETWAQSVALRAALEEAAQD